VRRRRVNFAAAVAAAAAAIALLAAPTSAQAARYRVTSGGGACAGTDTTCGSLTAAATAMHAGDKLSIAPGRYDESPRFAAPGLVVRGSKTAPGVVVDGTVTFAADGPPSAFENVAVSAMAPDAPSVLVSGTSGLVVRDASLFAADGNALTIAGSTRNAVIRSRLLSSRTGIAIGSGELALDSSIVSGGAGAGGAGIAAGGEPAYGLSGSASVTGHHVTIAGAPVAIVLNSAASAAMSDSIVLGTAPAEAGFVRTDRQSAPAALFVNPATRNFRLRPGSPALDRGQITPGDSATDVDGQPRTLGKASDLGADELDTVAPQVTVTRPRARQTLAVGSRLRLAGRAQDASGVASVVVAIDVLPSGRTCRWFSPQRGLVTRSCKDPVLVRARLAKDGTWSYDGPRRLKLPAARYRVRVYGTDRAGVFGNAARASRGRVTFRVGG
jgi:hypothetical protein